MEIIQLSGYDTPEKVEIARRYLEPRAREDTGLVEGETDVPSDLHLTEGAVNDLIRWYCREAGVRNLQKQIQKIYRKMALKVVRGMDEDESGMEINGSYVIDEGQLSELLGKPPFTSDRLYEEGTPPGVVMGLAWTSMGGASLYIECSAHSESGMRRAGNGVVVVVVACWRVFLAAAAGVVEVVAGVVAAEALAAAAVVVVVVASPRTLVCQQVDCTRRA